MPVYLSALLIGVASGLRSLTPLTAVSWAAHLGRLNLQGTWLEFLGFAATPYVLTVMAVGELIADKLPKTPSRKAPPGFIFRILTGALSGAALGAAAQAMTAGLLLGAIGAVGGTLGGYEARTRLVQATGGKDLPIALLEDVVTIAIAYLLVR